MGFCFNYRNNSEHMKKIIVAVVVYLLCVGSVYAEVSQFVFTNEGRTVAPGVISEALTVQSQNSGGTQESILETTDLVFQSSSPTGEFLNSSGNPVSTTMSKNTANRTFYYRDSGVGSHTITVTATGRETQKSFNATQVIVVGAGQTTSSTSESSENNTSSSSSDSIDTSSHSSPSSASGSKEVVSFEVSAGRKRFSSVGSEVIFKAEPVKLTGVPEAYIQYVWVFGDGTNANGQVVSHRYKFPGDYVVVLNATYSDKSAVSRTDVSVIEPVFTIEPVSGGVKVTNRSSGEVNLGEWVIEGARSRLEIPRDTIIQKGKSIVFSYNAITQSTDVLVLKHPLGTAVAEYRPIEKVETMPVVIEPVVAQEEPKVKIVYIEKPISKKETTVMSTSETKAETLPLSTKEINADDLVATVYAASPKSSALESFLWIPRKGWGILAGLFR